MTGAPSALICRKASALDRSSEPSGAPHRSRIGPPNEYRNTACTEFDCRCAPYMPRDSCFHSLILLFSMDP